MGYQAGYGLYTGSDNILIGFKTGYSLSSGSGNIMIGHNLDVGDGGTSNELNIGGLIKGDVSDGTVGIGAKPASASNILELTSTTQGFVLPRMTKAQRNAIATPVAGMAVYQTDNTPGLRVYNGTNWMSFNEAAD
jgi:hypothetical protein